MTCPTNPALIQALKRRLVVIQQQHAAAGAEISHIQRVLAMYAADTAPALTAALRRQEHWATVKYVDAILANEGEHTLQALHERIATTTGVDLSERTIGTNLRRGLATGKYIRRGHPRTGYLWSLAQGEAHS